MHGCMTEYATWNSEVIMGIAREVCAQAKVLIAVTNQGTQKLESCECLSASFRFWIDFRTRGSSST